MLSLLASLRPAMPLLADVAPPPPEIPTLYPAAYQSVIAGVALTAAFVAAGFLLFRRSAGRARWLVPVLLLVVGMGATAAVGYAVHERKESAAWREYRREARRGGGGGEPQPWELETTGPHSEGPATAEKP
jgi:hypothetical protein